MIFIKHIKEELIKEGVFFYTSYDKLSKTHNFYIEFNPNSMFFISDLYYSSIDLIIDYELGFDIQFIYKFGS